MADNPDASAVELSALGKKLLKEQECSAEREAYLEALRKKVKAGEYHIDVEALAEKLLTEVPGEILPAQRPEDEEAK